MATQTLIIPYEVNPKTVLNKAEMSSRFLQGLPMLTGAGLPMSEQEVAFHVQAAQTEVENYLAIKLNKTIISENRAFYRSDWISYGYIDTTFPVVEGLSVKGYYNNVLQSDFPKGWISTRRKTFDEIYARKLNLIPVGGVPFATSFLGLYPLATGRPSLDRLPNYWVFKYVTGFDKIPLDILNYIGKLAACNMLPTLANPLLSERGLLGLASNSLAIDGLRQSAAPAGAGTKSVFGSLIDAYQKDLDRTLPMLRSIYGKYVMGAL